MRALRLVYKDSRLTFEGLLEKDDSVTIHHRNLQKLAIEIYKLLNNVSVPIVKHNFTHRVVLNIHEKTISHIGSC